MLAANLVGVVHLQDAPLVASPGSEAVRLVPLGGRLPDPCSRTRKPAGILIPVKISRLTMGLHMLSAFTAMHATDGGVCHMVACVTTR